MKLEKITEITESDLSDAAKIIAIREIIHGPAAAKALASALGKSVKTIERRQAEVRRRLSTGQETRMDGRVSKGVAEEASDRRALGPMWAGAKSDA